ncbi:MAG: hypothetical protein IH991_09860 [Planctomycetes bacterium]|nr:hypothetical protein [Planctomycetota bacterium]
MRHASWLFFENLVLREWQRVFLGRVEWPSRTKSASVVCYFTVRPLLERILWPSSKVGVVSVYSPSTYTGGPAGLNVVDGRLGLFGANTFIFPNAAVRSLLSHGRIVNHRLSGPSAGLRLIDDVVGFWSHDRDMPAYYHTPSLGQHIGESSTIWNIDQLSGKRISSDFVGQEFDALCLEC